MKLLRNNARPEGWTAQVTCGKCGSAFEIESGDVEYGKWKVGGYWFDGSELVEVHYSAKCPACDHEANFIDGREADLNIPQGFKQDAQARYAERKAAGESII